MQKANKGELPNLKNKLLAEQVQEQIRQYIPETPIVVGAKLPNEFELGDRFSVGRSTIREAVKFLISRGTLEARRGPGTYVVSTIPVDMDPLGLGAVEDKVALALGLVNVCITLEPGVVEMAAFNVTWEDVLKLGNLCNGVERRIKIGDSHIEDDIAFHTCVAEYFKNRVVEQLTPIIDTAIPMFVNVTHGELIDETVMTHWAMTEATMEHNPIGAKTVMMMHMTFNRNMIRQLMEDGREAQERAGSVTVVRECDGGMGI